MDYVSVRKVISIIISHVHAREEFPSPERKIDKMMQTLLQFPVALFCFFLKGFIVLSSWNFWIRAVFFLSLLSGVASQGKVEKHADSYKG
jgi:hypothetical protein